MPHVREEVIELASLLSAPDPPDLPRRSARLTQPGDPRRRETVLLPLLVRWAQWRCLAADPEPLAPPRAVVRGKRRVLVYARPMRDGSVAQNPGGPLFGDAA